MNRFDKFRSLTRHLSTLNFVYIYQWLVPHARSNWRTFACLTQFNAQHLKTLHENVCLSTQFIRFKTNKRNSKTSNSGYNQDNELNDDDDDDDDDETDADVNEEAYKDIIDDFDAPTVYRHSIIHSQRANIIISKGLGISNSAAERIFYASRFLYNGKTLLKKSQKIEEGEYVDIVHEEKNGKLLVQRVKVLKVLDKVTKKGKSVIAIRSWRKQFEIDNPKA